MDNLIVCHQAAMLYTTTRSYYQQHSRVDGAHDDDVKTRSVSFTDLLLPRHFRAREAGVLPSSLLIYGLGVDNRSQHSQPAQPNPLDTFGRVPVAT